MPYSGRRLLRSSTSSSRSDDALSEPGSSAIRTKLCVRPGDTVTFHVSGAGADTFDAQLVRLIHGDTQPAGPGFQEIEVPSTVDGTHPLLGQLTHHGSYARIPDAGGLVDRAGEPA